MDIIYALGLFVMGFTVGLITMPILLIISDRYQQHLRYRQMMRVRPNKDLRVINRTYASTLNDKRY